LTFRIYFSICEEFRSVIYFLNLKRLTCKDIEAEIKIKDAYGPGRVALRTVQKCVKFFQDWRISLSNAPRSWIPKNAELIDQIGEFIQNDPTISQKKIYQEPMHNAINIIYFINIINDINVINIRNDFETQGESDFNNSNKRFYTFELHFENVHEHHHLF
jgi:hypothetical protein